MTSTTASFSSQDIDTLKKQIEQSVPGQLGGGADDIRKTFCDTWPAARSGLEGLRTVLSFVPGVNVFAGPAIAIVLAAGDAAKSAVCSN